MIPRAAAGLSVLFLGTLATSTPAREASVPSPTASDASPAAPAAHVSLSAAPVFGADASTGDGWLEVVARVGNEAEGAVRGTLELSGTYGGYYGPHAAVVTFSARAPFHVPGRSQTVIHIPMRGTGRSAPAATVTAIDDTGAKLAEAAVAFGSSSAPLLVDFDDPSRLSIVMRGWPIAPTWHPAFSPYVPTGTTTSLSVGSPAVNEVTGDLLLPDHSASYSAVTLVVVSSERLAHVDGPALDALVGWVMSGGTIAVYPSRPEDRRAGVLTTLVGGPFVTTQPPAMMMTLPGASRPGSSHAAPSVAPAVGPSPPLRARLAGYVGGNLHPSAYGATAPYGLGQVHVLGFDPESPPAIDDEWTHGRLLDMLDEAWERHALVVFPHGSGVQHATNLYEVRRALDPNENFRPALGVAAILLVLYSIVTGPVAFLRATRRARPLAPLFGSAVASAGCFALLVVVGLAGKGWSGRARRIALVEAAAGMSRGSVRRFRGFFSSQTRAMRVRGSDPGSVLDVMTGDSGDQGPAVLRIDKEGASLEGITSLPWQTVVVSEDGFVDLRGGIGVREKPDGSVVVTNHTGRKLKDVVVWAPKSDASWFPALADGESVLSTSGRTLFVPSARVPGTAGSLTVHALDAPRFSSALGGHAAEEMAQAWSALGSAAGSSIDWWPDSVPIVLGEIDGGERRSTDSGLPVESDRLYFRVVGEGGAT